MPILWTFENPEKLKPFTTVLNDNNITFEILSKNGKVDIEKGLIISVEEFEFKKAKKILLSYRKRISNRHSKQITGNESESRWSHVYNIYYTVCQKCDNQKLAKENICNLTGIKSKNTEWYPTKAHIETRLPDRTSCSLIIG